MNRALIARGKFDFSRGARSDPDVGFPVLAADQAVRDLGSGLASCASMHGARPDPKCSLKRVFSEKAN